MFVGAGYRKGDLQSGPYGTVSFAVTRETARYFAVTARAGAHLASVGFIVALMRRPTGLPY